ncbi:MAG TPA: primosome assembly protein PriA, partial [Actinomycetales bacterium]
WHAGRELAERTALRFPPASTVLTLTGPPAAVQALAAASGLPPGVERLGPVPVVEPVGRGRRAVPAPADAPGEPSVRLLLRSSVADGDRLAAAVRAGVSVRSARKDVGSVKVQRDPLELV